MRLLLSAALMVPVIHAAELDLLPKDDFIKQWEISKQFTLDVAAKMPAEHYTSAHHRAQIEVYLRLKKIAPPSYTF